MNIWRGWRYYAYHFRYIWAHQPLCSRFHGETLNIHGVHLCRSCTLVYIGCAVGIFTPLNQLTYLVVLATSLLATLSTSYKKLPRRARDACRFALGWTLAATARLAVSVEPVSLLGSALITISYFRLHKSRRQRILRECDNCPEKDFPAVCSGYRQQAASLEKYHERLTELAYAKRKESYGTG